MSNPIELRVNGVATLDFTSARVTYSMDQLARTFSFSLTDKWLNSGQRDLPFIEGDPVEIFVHGQKVIDGIIDDIPISYDATSHNIQVTGRSRVGQLVDSSAVHETGSWKDVTIETLSKALCAPHGIAVKVEPEGAALAAEPFRKWAIEDEETVFGCISRAAKMRALFLLGDSENSLLITKASRVEVPHAFIFGKNILRGRRTSRYTERHSLYVIKSQNAGDDTFFADQVGKGFYQTEDPQVLNYRPLIIISDGQGNAAELQTRGNWERNVRAGKSRRISYDVRGFLNDSGDLYEINRLAVVQDSYLDFDGQLLITSVSMNYGPGGEMTTVELGAPEGYDALEKPKKRRKKKGGGPLW